MTTTDPTPLAEQQPDCAPDCEERARCTDINPAGHFACGTCTHGVPRHHGHLGCARVEVVQP